MTLRKKIPLNEIVFSNLSLVDVGRVFHWGGRIFRAIYPEHEQHVRELFDSGLIAALVSKGLFVRSWISDYELDGFSLVVEHELIEVVTYPREWSYSMLKKASLAVLHLNQTSGQFGYQTKDCHTYNTLFSGTRPVYVDLGSFVRAESNSDDLLSSDLFLRAYYYPLRLWALFGREIAERLIQSPSFFLKTEDYLKIRWPVFRSSFGAKLAVLLSKVQKIPNSSDIGKSAWKRKHGTWKVRAAFLVKPLLSMGLGSIKKVQNRIIKERRMMTTTMWSNYHDRFDDDRLPQRFTDILGHLRSAQISSLLEIGGNQGLLCRALKHIRPELKVTCTDPDEIAIDKGFCDNEKTSHGINWAVLNPFYAESHISEDEPVRRFRSDVVVALALTHHLVLSQGLSLGRVLDVISEYADKFVYIEFMPLGLHDGMTGHPVPSWYTVDWFQHEFESRFTLMEKMPLEENRVLFIGTKHAG